MTFLLQISAMVLMLSSACLGQDIARSHMSKAFVADINDSIQAEVNVLYDLSGEPDAYVSHIRTPVCEEGLCKLMDIIVYWDLLGNFLKYDFSPGETLTKLDHQEFSKEDHEHLQKILSDKGSILRDYPAGDLLDRRMGPAKTDKVDAVTSATRADIKESVVSGAAYSTYVLWHIVNGPIALRIQEYSKPFLSRERINKMFYSPNFYYQYYALTSIPAEDSLKYLDEVIHLVKHGSSYIPYFAIDKVSASAWALDSVQRSMLKFLASADFELQNFILSRIEEVKVSSAALDMLVSDLDRLRDSQVVKALAIVRENQERLSDGSRSKLARLRAHSNREVARDVTDLLN
jgi:hypothetical protein